tara:strand:- start:3254 stop:4012 length:759 start_codon:yes stop_codon:yes gene_type:complete
MKQVLICHGCSFTRWKWHTWPTFLHWFDKTNILNFGHVGSGNETISREVVHSVYKYNKQIKHMYVMWSGPDRYEVIQDDDKETIAEPTGWLRFFPDFNWAVWFCGHPDQKKHNEYQKHFLNEEHNYFKTLERILYTQMILEKENIPYTMMVYNKQVIKHDNLSMAQQEIYNAIDWTKFKFYKDKLGLDEFAHENYPDQFDKGDGHPLPFAHYKWVKDIIFKTEIDPPEYDYEKLDKNKISKNLHGGGLWGME